MNNSIAGKLKRIAARLFFIIRERSVFELGISASLYYGVIFFLTPILIWLGLVTEHRFFKDLFSYAFSLTALWYEVAGLGGILVGYFFIFPRKLFLRLPNIFAGEWDALRVPRVFWITFILGVCAKVLRVAGGVYLHAGRKAGFLVDSSFLSAVGFLDWLSSIALLIAFLRYFSLLKDNNPQARIWRWIAWAVFAGEILYAIPSCSRALLIAPIILYLIARAYVLGLRNWQIILIVGAIFAVVMPFGPLCLSVNSESTVARLLYRDGGFAVENIPTVIQVSVLSRTNQNIVISKIVGTESTAEPPLQCRDIAADFMTVLGPPRFLWKDKPIIGNEGNEFGRRLGLVLPDDFETGIGATVVGSWYFYCGFWGILFGMAALGFLWRAIYAYLIENARSLSGIMIYAVLWVNIIKGMENEIVPVYAGLVKIFVILTIIHFFLRKRPEA